jgi:hypothetical protein
MVISVETETLQGLGNNRAVDARSDDARDGYRSDSSDSDVSSGKPAELAAANGAAAASSDMYQPISRSVSKVPSLDLSSISGVPVLQVCHYSGYPLCYQQYLKLHAIEGSPTSKYMVELAMPSTESSGSTYVTPNCICDCRCRRSYAVSHGLHSSSASV